MKPGTRSRWVSRESHTCSNALSAPLMTLKRFIAMYMALSLMSDAGAGRLVDEAPGLETRQIEGAADLVVRAGRHEMREQRSAGGDGLEPSGSPAAVEKDSLDRRRPDDGGRVRNDVDDAAPLAHQLQLAEGRERVEKAGDDGLLHRRRAALAVGRNAVETAAEDDLALVGLARVDAGPDMKNNDVEARLHRLAHHRLQRIGMNRQPDARLGHELRGMASDCDPDRLRANFALRGLDAHAGAVLQDEAQSLAILDNVDAELVGGARIAPGDRVMARGSATALPDAAVRQIAGIERLRHQRQLLADLVRTPQFRVDAVELHRVHEAGGDLEIGFSVGEIEDAALAQHDVEIELARQPLIKPERKVVEGDRFGIEVIRSYDRRVAAGVAAAEPALLDHA